MGLPEILSDPEFRSSGTQVMSVMIERAMYSNQSRAVALVEAIYAQFKFLKIIPAGKDRARAVYDRIDELIEAQFKRRPDELAEISCRKYCAACCHLEVSITEDEATLLAELIQGGVEIDRDRLEAQSKLECDDWVGLSKDERKCVFLGNKNSCRIYSDRPASCRKYFVTTPPANCDDIHGRSKVYAIDDVEIIASAALNVKPNWGPLAKLLREKLK